jgi:tRNA pseudouridine38-40 synthase
MKYKLTIQYLGANFSGWQSQPGKRTVQGEIEKVLANLLHEEIVLSASGRTDKGVNAFGQVASFSSETVMKESKLRGALNAFLPEDISIIEVEYVEDSFDARFNAKIKTYEYYFYKSINEQPIYKGRELRINDYADVDKMREAAKAVVGTHDFTSFVARKSGKTNMIRTVYDIKIEDLGNDHYKLVITGNGFLYNMVRIIMGTLIMIGQGQREVGFMAELIEAKNRKLAGNTVAPYALYLKEVKY